MGDFSDAWLEDVGKSLSDQGVEGSVSAETPDIGPHSAAIASIESGGNYRALGPLVRRKDGSLDRAYGVHQVMGANIPSWTKAALGYAMSPQQFLRSKEAQDQVFAHRFGQYLDTYGPEGAASMWFTGRPEASNAKDVLGTSRNKYVRQYLAALGQGSQEVPAAQPSQEAPNPEGLEDIEKGLLGQFSTPQTEVPAPSKGLPPAGPEWNAPREFASGFTWDKAPQVNAAVNAGKEALGDIARGTPPAAAWELAKSVYYPQALTQYQEAQKTYEREQPGQAMLARTAGQMVPALAGVGLANAGLRAAGAAVPRLAPPAEFLGGTGGGGFWGQRASDMAAGAFQGAIADAATGHNPLVGAGIGAGIGLPLGWAGRALTAPMRATTTPEIARAAEPYIAQGGEVPASAIVQGSVVPMVKGLAGPGEAEAIQRMTDLLAKRVGAANLSPGELANARDAYNGAMRNWEQNSFALVDGQFTNDLAAVARKAATARAKGSLPGPVADEVVQAVRDIADVARRNAITQPGQPATYMIPGDAFKNVLSSQGIVDELFNVSSKATPYAKDLKRALFDVLKRTDPQAHQELRALDTRYRDLVRLEKIPSSSPNGLVDPARLKRFAGQDDELGKIAQFAQAMPKMDYAGNVKGAHGGLAHTIAQMLPEGFMRTAAGAGLGLGGIEAIPHVAQAFAHAPAATLGLAALGGTTLAGLNRYSQYLGSQPYTQRVIENTLRRPVFTLVNPLVAGGTPLLSERQR